MRVIFIVYVVFFIGCSQRYITNSIDNSMASMAGNEPPSTFKFLNHNDSNEAKFNFKKFELLLPLAKADDWISMGGWYGASSSRYFWDRLDIQPAEYKGGSWVSYYFMTNVSTRDYDTYDEAVQRGDVKYLKSIGEGKHVIYIKRYGKENYPCIVSRKSAKIGKKIQTYTCYKYSPDKRKVTQVHLRFVSTFVPNTPAEYRNLKYKYNLDNLILRANRTLDSLYIKDNW